MTPREADWVYEHVLTAAYKRGAGCDDQGPAAVRTCPCEYGPCGWCSIGRSEKCAHRLGTSPRTTFDTFLEGYEVRRSGKPCRWVCPGPPPDQPDQLELFAVGAR